MAVALVVATLLAQTRSESFPLRVTGWPVELMAYAFLVVSPPDMSQRFEEMAVAASNKSSSKPGLSYPDLEEQALQFILDYCESNIEKYTKYFEGGDGSPEVSMNAKQANRTLLLKQRARDLCISEWRILYHTQYILRRRLRDMRGTEYQSLIIAEYLQFYWLLHASTHSYPNQGFERSRCFDPYKSTATETRPMPPCWFHFLR